MKLTVLVTDRAHLLTAHDVAARLVGAHTPARVDVVVAGVDDPEVCIPYEAEAQVR